jgi:hypothetical protein
MPRGNVEMPQITNKVGDIDESWLPDGIKVDLIELKYLKMCTILRLSFF